MVVRWTSRLADGLRDGGVPTQDLTTALVVADNTTSVISDHLSMSQ